MSSGEATQIAVAVVLTLTLAAVAYYAKQASRQAEASLKMAEEMREARHGGVLPVVDFVFEPLDSSEELSIALQVRAGQFPETMWAHPRNIGIGPALDVRFRTKLGDTGPGWHSVGHLGIGEVAEEGYAGPRRWPFYLDPISDSVKRLSVEYSDAYGRTHISLREITFDVTEGDWEIGALHTRRLKHGIK